MAELWMQSILKRSRKISLFDSNILTPFCAKGYNSLNLSSISLVGWHSLPVPHFPVVLFRTCPKQVPGAGQVDVSPLCVVATSLPLLTLRRRDWQAFPTHLLRMGFMCFCHVGTSSWLSSPAHTTPIIPIIHISFTKICSVQAVGFSAEVRLYTWVRFNQ